MKATAAIMTIPNSYDISSRPLGDTTSPIVEDETKILPGDIVLSRARTLTMHTIIALGQIYKFSWDKDNTFRFWSHPAMIVAVKGQRIKSRDGAHSATVKDTVLVQATVNPAGVNFALLSEFRRNYSSRLWIFSPLKFTPENRMEAVFEAELEAGGDLYDWLKSQNLLEAETTDIVNSMSARIPDVPRRQFTYGLLSLASILVSQLFPKWKFRFFNEGQVTCSGFIAELMERAGYSFDSEIHAFPADVAEKLYEELGVFQERGVDSWVQGAARLRRQISEDKKLSLENAKKLKLSRRAWSLLALGAAITVGAMVVICGLISHLSWPLWLAIVVIVAYLSVVAAPIIVYSLLAYLKISFVGIPKLVRMLRPLYWRKEQDMQ
jgi:hypothetical protein